MHPPGSPWESHFLSQPHFSFFFHFYVIQLDLSYLLITKCIIIGLMFMPFSNCHKDSCFVGTATYLAPGIESDIWWMPRKYSLNAEMNRDDLFHLSIPRSYCHKSDEPFHHCALLPEDLAQRTRTCLFSFSLIFLLEKWELSHFFSMSQT